MKKLLLLSFLIPLTVMAQKKLDESLLWQFGRITEQAVSPDGKTALYVVKNYNVAENKGATTVFAKSINGNTNPQIVLNDAVNASSVRYTPDGKKISYMAAVEGNMQLFEVNTDGTSPKLVTNIKGDINGYRYSPKMNHIALVIDVKLDQTVSELYPDLDKTKGRIIDNLFYRHWDAWHDYAYSHLFLQPYGNHEAIGDPIDLMAGERFDCPIPPMGDDDDYTWSPDGFKIAYSSKKLHGTEDAVSTNSDIYVYDLNTKVTRNVSEANRGYDRNPQFSPDGSKLAWLSMEEEGNESDRNTLVMFDYNKPFNATAPADGKRVSDVKMLPWIQPLTNHFDYTLDNFVWLDNARLAFTAVIEATKQVCMFDPKLKSMSRVVVLTKGDHDFGAINTIPGNNKTLLASKMSISSPTELCLVDMAKGNITPFTGVNSALLSSITMGKVEKRMVKTTDGKDMLVWVILPPDFNPAKKYPTLLYCQGGPQSPVSQFFSYRWNFQLMAAHGYVVVAPNRRGLPGFGSEWNDAITNDYGGQCMQDYLSAIDDVSKESWCDKSRLGAVGASFGGYSVYWLAGNHNKRFKTFIAHCGMFNMESWYGTTEEMFFANHDNGGPYWEQRNKQSNFTASPHLFIQNWDTPILIIHNEKDFRVPLGQGMEAFTAAQLKGLKSRFLYFPDENHWVTKPQNSILWQRVFFEWLQETL